eukprot:scaffold19141_cov34-Tisochrysis_lutea.AAC.1
MAHAGTGSGVALEEGSRQCSDRPLYPLVNANASPALPPLRSKTSPGSRGSARTHTSAALALMTRSRRGWSRRAWWGRPTHARRPESSFK